MKKIILFILLSISSYSQDFKPYAAAVSLGSDELTLYNLSYFSPNGFLNDIDHRITHRYLDFHNYNKIIYASQDGYKFHGAIVKTFKEATANSCEPQLHYRSYKAGTPAPEFQFQVLNYYSGCNTGSNEFIDSVDKGPCNTEGYQKWKLISTDNLNNNFKPIDLANQNEGNYILEVFVKLYGSNNKNDCSDIVYDNNSGENYVMNYTVCSSYKRNSYKEPTCGYDDGEIKLYIDGVPDGVYDDQFYYNIEFYNESIPFEGVLVKDGVATISKLSSRKYLNVRYKSKIQNYCTPMEGIDFDFSKGQSRSIPFPIVKVFCTDINPVVSDLTSKGSKEYWVLKHSDEPLAMTEPLKDNVSYYKKTINYQTCEVHYQEVKVKFNCEVQANEDIITNVISTSRQQNIINVLDNDLVGGLSIDINSIFLIEVESDETGQIKLNDDGAITLLENTKPGVYSLEYQICNNQKICDKANVEVRVTSSNDCSTITPPLIESINHPTCSSNYGGVHLLGLPSGIWEVKEINSEFTHKGLGEETYFGNLNPDGVYQFVVTSEDGCTSLASKEVIINSELEIPSRPEFLLSCGESWDKKSMSITRPIGDDYEYSVNDSEFQSSPIFKNLSGSTFVVKVVNQNGCVSEPVYWSVNCEYCLGNKDDIHIEQIQNNLCDTNSISISGYYDNFYETYIYTNGKGQLNSDDITESPFAIIYSPHSSEIDEEVTVFLYPKYGFCVFEVTEVTFPVTKDNSCLGRNEFELTKGISIAPNPVSDNLNIISKNASQIESIEIFNTQGQLIQSIQEGFLEGIDVSHLSKGIYLIKVRTDRGVIITKIIKE